MTGGRRVFLVARREWNQRAGSAAFRISTLLSAGLVVLIIAAPQIYGGMMTPTRTIGLVGDASPRLPALLHAAGDQLGYTLKTREYADEASAESALRSGDVDLLIVGQAGLVWESDPEERLQAVVTSAVQSASQERTVAELGLTPEQAQQLLKPPPLASRSLEPTTGERSSQTAMAVIGMVLLMMAISVYGGFLVVGVVEEKSSRVVEVVLSRLRPAELMTGKIAGIGLVGLAQFAVVALTAWVTLALSDDTRIPSTAPETIGWIVFWFVLGYAFYSVLYAAAGSLVSRQEEAQSMTFPVTAVLILSYLFALAAVGSPDSAAAVIGSLLPPTAPMVMIVRIANGAVPWWQILLSVALMLVTIYGLVQLASRIYSGAVLRMGRRVKLREAWRSGDV